MGDIDPILALAAKVLGPVDVVEDVTRHHPGDRSRVRRLRTPDGEYGIKSYAERDGWEHEVHAYGEWTPALGSQATQLLAVQETPPAILTTWLPGRVAEGAQLATEQELELWHDAGHALAILHSQPASASFGTCDRHGRPKGTSTDDAQAYVTGEFESWIERGERLSCLDADEMTFLRTMQEDAAVFAGERPTPCHRDWCPANWIVDDAEWVGAIDWEFAYPDVRAADVSRYPSWEWIDRPELVEAFDDGYAKVLMPPDPKQRFVARALYALTAVVWGRETGYAGFQREGHDALTYLRAQGDS